MNFQNLKIFRLIFSLVDKKSTKNKIKSLKEKIHKKRDIFFRKKSGTLKKKKFNIY
jgi:hypothetical protein